MNEGEKRLRGIWQMIEDALKIIFGALIFISLPIILLILAGYTISIMKFLTL